ncbi:MFS transporter [Sphaerisporangium sp. NPDC088356]|uniref:MFS transporter n=1 Tax=Sphaerisporangium sp. NPDC088356 TaxID=3154871 RepID=UPI003426B8B1
MDYETMRGVMHANLPLRLARSAVFAVVCLTLASVAHRFAGGGGPTSQALLSGGLVVMTVTAALAGRERSPVTVTGLLLLAQAFLHRLLGTAGAPVSPPSHGHGPGETPLGHGPGVSAGLPLGHGLGVSAGMLLAHLTAALLTGWWVSRGDAVLWSVLRRAGAYATRRLTVLLHLLRQDVTPTPPGVPFGRAEEAIRPVCDRVLRHAVVRRGPPVLPVL